MTLTAETIRPITSRIVDLLENKCISMNGRRVDWAEHFKAAQTDIESSSSPSEFERRVTDVLERGGLSHVAFFHAAAQHVPARYAICATFLEADTLDGRRWMFQDVHEGGPAHEAGIRPGDVLLSVDGQDSEPPVPPRFRIGPDAAVVVRRPYEERRQVTLHLPQADPRRNGKGTPPMALPAPVTGRLLEPGIGYVRVAFFPGASGQPFARMFDTAVHSLDGCERLIIDLRGNLGGFVGALRLMSYLTPERVPVGYSLTRRGAARSGSPDRLPALDRLPETAADKIRMLWRFKVLHRDRSVRLVTEGLGPKPFHGRVVMLVNEHTASAAEMVAGFASERRLATLVGTRTAGQVLGGANFAVGQNFTLRLPAAAWHRWDGTILEAAGVSPDIVVPADPVSLAAGTDLQLTAAVNAVRDM